jgi:hypothetical protein
MRPSAWGGIGPNWAELGPSVDACLQ